MASGVKVDSACKQAYDDLHNKHLHGYIIFRISDDDTTIIVEKKGEKGSPYSEKFQKSSEAERNAGTRRWTWKFKSNARARTYHQNCQKSSLFNSKIFRIIWINFSCPDEAPVRRRMLYASSVRALKATLGLESLMQVQASDLSDIDEKAIKHELMSHQRI